MSLKVKVIQVSEEDFKELLNGFLKPIHDELYELRSNTDLQTFSLREASEMTKIPYTTLLSAAKKGTLKALHENQTFRVTRTNLLDYLKGK